MTDTFTLFPLNVGLLCFNRIVAFPSSVVLLAHFSTIHNFTSSILSLRGCHREELSHTNDRGEHAK